MSVQVAKNPRVGYSWGILLGMAGIPVFALMLKVFPKYETVWDVLMVVCGLIVARSLFGYIFPNGIGKKEEDAVDKGAHQH